jgi:hypothetical protein
VQHGAGEGDGVASVRESHGVGEALVGQQIDLSLNGDDGDRAARAGLRRRRQRQRAALAGPSDHADDRRLTSVDVLAHDPSGEGRRAADIHHGKGQRGGQVGRHHGGDGASEEHGVPLARNLLAGAVPAGEVVGDDQRGQRQRHQRGHDVSDREPERRLGTDLGDRAGEHPAGPGHRVVHLAAGGHDVEHLCPDGIPVACVLLEELTERRRVQVEPGHVDPDLVRP